MASRMRAWRGARLSVAARAWERAMLQEFGLEDVTWDSERCCPRCRAAEDEARRVPVVLTRLGLLIRQVAWLGVTRRPHAAS